MSQPIAKPNTEIAKSTTQPTIVALMEKMKGEITRALPRHVTPDRFMRVCLTEIRKNPKLMQCEPMSFIGAIVQCSQLGLEPGSGLGHAYLIPFRNNNKNITECVFVPGFKGYIDLARRSGKITSIAARLVHEKDQFSYAYGDDEKIVHIPSNDPDPGRITYVYAIAKFKDGGDPQREVMTRAQIDKVYKKYVGKNPLWDEHFDEMARKTAIRRLAKYLPLSPEMSQAIEADDSAFEAGQANWGVIDMDYEPAPTHDPKKNAEVHNAPDIKSPSDVEKLNALLDELTALCDQVEAKGQNPDEIVKHKICDLVNEKNFNKLQAAKMMLEQWMRK